MCLVGVVWEFLLALLRLVLPLPPQSWVLAVRVHQIQHCWIWTCLACPDTVVGLWNPQWKIPNGSVDSVPHARVKLAEASHWGL